MAERARQQLERQHIPLHGTASDPDSIQVTASLGVAALEPSVFEAVNTPRVLIQLADRALDAAKRAGRNRVRVFKPHAPRSDAA